MKQCSACGIKKKLGSFSKRGTGLQSKCKQCNREYQKEHYVANKSAYLERNRKRREEFRKWLREIKERSGCIDCGVKYPAHVLDFDHLGVEEKIAGLSQMVHDGHALVKLKEEIAKCEVVCANCHRERTYRRNSK